MALREPLLIARRSRDFGLLQLHAWPGPAVLDGYTRPSIGASVRAAHVTGYAPGD